MSARKGRKFWGVHVIEVDFTDEEKANAAAKCSAFAGALRDTLAERFPDWKKRELIAALGAVAAELLLSEAFSDENRAEWLAVMSATLFGGQVYQRVHGASPA